MADKTIRLVAPNGATVVAAAEKEAELLRRGFTSESAKAPAKKAAPSKTEK